jgi:antitoxin (DNA-binding transcriptional repressor) of toxin-antitoxin stability system
MKTASVRDLHLKTSAILAEVEQGETFYIEKNGKVIGELKYADSKPTPRFPDRSEFLATLPKWDEDFTTQAISEDRDRGLDW